MARSLRSLLLSAAREGDTETLVRLLTQEPELEKAPAPRLNASGAATPLSKRTEDMLGGALRLAAQNGHLGCVQALLPLGVVDQRDALTRYTPLMLAAQNGHAACAQALVTHSDANLQVSGDSALMLAVRAEQPACVSVLAPHTDLIHFNALGIDVFSVAAKLPTSECLRILLSQTKVTTDESIAQILRAGSRNAETPLMRAAEQGAMESVHLLLPLSNPLHQSARGYTALMKSTLGGCASTIQALLPASDPRACNEYGRTALMLSAVSSQRTPPEALRGVLRVSDPLARDKSGRTALMIAAHCGNPTAVRILLPMSNPASKDTEGRDAAAIALEAYMKEQEKPTTTDHLGCFDLLASSLSLRRLATLAKSLPAEALVSCPQTTAILERVKLDRTLKRSASPDRAASPDLAADPARESVGPSALDSKTTPTPTCTTTAIEPRSPSSRKALRV